MPFSVVFKTLRGLLFISVPFPRACHLVGSQQCLPSEGTDCLAGVKQQTLRPVRHCECVLVASCLSRLLVTCHDSWHIFGTTTFGSWVHSNGKWPQVAISRATLKGNSRDVAYNKKWVWTLAACLHMPSLKCFLDSCGKWMPLGGFTRQKWKELFMECGNKLGPLRPPR